MSRTYPHLYIGGEWVAPSTDSVMGVVNPATEEVVATVPAGTSEDADRAVRAARDAFDSWAETAPGRRAELLTAVARGLADHKQELAELITDELGMPLQQSLDIQASMPIANFEF